MQSTLTITSRSAANALHRPPAAVRIAGFALVVLVLEVVLARGAVGEGAMKYLLLLVGALGAALVLRFPLPTALVFFAFTDFIFYPLHFAQNVGPLNVRPYELLLVLLLVLAVARPKRRTWGGVPGAALAIFFVLLALSAGLAVSAGDTSATEAFNWARALGLLGFFYVVVRLFPTPRERELLLTGMAAIAAATGFVAVLISLGAGFGESLQAAAGNAIREQGSVERVRLPGLSAGYGLFWYAAIQVAQREGRGKAWWLLLLGGISLDVIVSFNRNMWVGILVGMVVMAALGGPVLRRQLAAVLTGAATLLVFFVLVGGSAGNETIEPVIERGETLVNPSKTAQESSLESRAAETEAAWQEAKEHPVFGVGPGVGFGVFITEAVRSGDGTVTGFSHTPQFFLHNQYIYLLLIAGIPGLIAFLVFLGHPVVTALRRRDDLSQLALGVGVAMIMLSSVVAIYFTVVDMTAVLALLTGVIVAASEDGG